jgi:hypothetical protein
MLPRSRYNVTRRRSFHEAANWARLLRGGNPSSGLGGPILAVVGTHADVAAAAGSDAAAAAYYPDDDRPDDRRAAAAAAAASGNLSDSDGFHTADEDDSPLPPSSRVVSLAEVRRPWRPFWRPFSLRFTYVTSVLVKKY